MKRLAIRGIALVLAISAGLAAPAAVANAAPAGVERQHTLRDYVAYRDAHRAAAAAQGVTTFSAVCLDHIALYSVAAQRYVTVEMNQTGIRENMLRARATEASTWEDLTLCYDSAGYDYIYSWSADMYVSTEVNYATFRYMLRARTHVVGPWEKYTIDCSDYCYIYSWGAGKYVTVEMNYTGSDKWMLRARADREDSWERFLRFW